MPENPRNNFCLTILMEFNFFTHNLISLRQSFCVFLVDAVGEGERA